MSEQTKSFSLPQWVIYGMLLLGGSGGGTIGSAVADRYLIPQTAKPEVNMELIEYRLLMIESELKELNVCCGQRTKD